MIAWHFLAEGGVLSPCNNSSDMILISSVVHLILPNTVFLLPVPSSHATLHLQEKTQSLLMHVHVYRTLTLRLYIAHGIHMYCIQPMMMLIVLLSIVYSPWYTRIQPMMMLIVGCGYSCPLVAIRARIFYIEFKVHETLPVWLPFSLWN